MASYQTTAMGEWPANWTVVLAGAAGSTLSLTYLYSLGIVMPDLEREFGWSRAEISSGPMIIAVAAVVFVPLVGGLIDRYGPRKIGLLGTMLFVATLAALSLAGPDIWTWWALWSFLAVAATMVSPTTWTSAVSQLFVRSRGAAIAFVLTGTSLGSIVVPQIATILADHGWRAVYLGMAVAWGAIALPLIFLFFRGADPIAPSGGVARVPAADRAVEVGPLLRTSRYLKVLVGACAITLVSAGMAANMVPIVRTNGISPSTAAGIASMIGVGSLVGRLLGGYLLDRINANWVAGAFVAAPTISMVLLLYVPGSVVAASTAAMVIGLAAGVEYDAVAYLVGRHFGLRVFGRLFGTVTGGIMLMAGIGPFLTNAIYDGAHSYDPALWGSLPICVLSSILFFTLGDYPILADSEPTE